MDERAKCPACGRDIPPDAPGAACPHCALAGALPAPDSGPTADEVAAKLPAFEILGMLGRGGMGVVFKARQKALDRVVALKVLPPASARTPGFSDRFQREAKAMARLTHPNIVAVHEFGQVVEEAGGGLFYLVLEFIDGLNIREAMAAGRIRPSEAMTIVPQICDALQYAHDRGVVHRDIKPENVLIDREGRVKIADFGLAKLAVPAAGDASLTGTGQVMGTLRYMAPEQWERPSEVDHRADIYSLGVVFYEMLTGELPVGKFEPPSAKAQIDVRVDDVVMRAIERDRERRWQHASEVKTQMGVISAGAAAAPPAAVVEKKQKKDDSHWDWEGPQGMNAVTMFAVAAISAVGALAWNDGEWLWWMAGPAALTGVWCTAKWFSDRRAAASDAAAPSGPPLYDDLFGPAAQGARWSKLAWACLPAGLVAWLVVGGHVRSVDEAARVALPTIVALFAVAGFAWARVRHSRGALRGLSFAGAGVLAAAALVPFAAILAWNGESARRQDWERDRDWEIASSKSREESAAHPRVVEGVEIPVDVPDGGEDEYVQRRNIEALVRRLQIDSPLVATQSVVWAHFYAFSDWMTLMDMPSDRLPGKMSDNTLGLPLLPLDPKGPRLADFHLTAIQIDGGRGTVTLDHAPSNTRLIARVERDTNTKSSPLDWKFSLAPVERSTIVAPGQKNSK